MHTGRELGLSEDAAAQVLELGDAWEAVERHATYTEQILGRIRQFSTLARVAAAHHERLDGSGHPRGVGAEAIVPETRIITVADVFDAINATRPYRAAIPIDASLAMMRGQVGPAIDGDCFAALERMVASGASEVEELALAGC